MLAPIYAIARSATADRELSWEDQKARDAIVAIHPHNTSAGLTPVIHTEKDVEDYVMNVILNPSVSAHLVSSTPRGNPYPDLCSTGRHADAEECSIYVSSSGDRDGAIPDALLMNGVHVEATAEVKTDKVLQLNVKDSTIFSALQRVHKDSQGNELPGAAIKFVWPVKGRKSSMSKASKVLMQVRIHAMTLLFGYSHHQNPGLDPTGQQ